MFAHLKNALQNGKPKMSTPSNKNDNNFCQLRAVKIWLMKGENEKGTKSVTERRSAINADGIQN